MRLSRAICFFIALGGVVIGGCTDEEKQLFQMFLGGRLLDAETRLPIGGAQVEVCNLGESTSTNGNGEFGLLITPGLQGGFLDVAFRANGYAALGLRVPAFPDSSPFDGSLDNKDFIDIGTVSLRRGVDLNLIVTMDGVPFSGARLFATPEDFGSGESTTGGCSLLDVLATTNADGAAWLVNLDPFERYRIIVPSQDTNGDNVPDNNSRSRNHTIAFDGPTLALNVDRLDSSRGVFIEGHDLRWWPTGSFFFPTGPINDSSRSTGSFGHSCLNNRSSSLNEFVSFSGSLVSPSQAVTVVLNQPATVTEPHFRYRDNLRDPADSAYNQDVRIPATMTALTGTLNTVYRFTPTSALPTNEVVTLDFIARPTFSPQSPSNQELDFYVPILGTSITTPYLDNFNGSQDGSGGSNEVQLVFREVVSGFYKVLDIRVGTSVTTFENPFEWFFQFQNEDQIAFNLVAAPATGTNTGESGVEVGNRYSTKLRDQFSSFLFLNDDGGGSNTSVTVAVAVQDAEGNQFTDVLNLPVR